MRQNSCPSHMELKQLRWLALKFCGRARLSQSLRSQSFQVFSIDHKPFKNVAVLQIDLNSEIEKRLFWDLVRNNRVLYVHFAPPCGTASAARNIRMSATAHGPPPLRSLAQPIGLDDPSPINQQRVELANNLYIFVAEAVQWLDARGIAWSIENPSSSLMWVTDPMQRLSVRLNTRFFGLVFDTCMLRQGSNILRFGPMWHAYASMQRLVTNRTSTMNGESSEIPLQQHLSVPTTNLWQMLGLLASNSLL